MNSSCMRKSRRFAKRKSAPPARASERSTRASRASISSAATAEVVAPGRRPVRPWGRAGDCGRARGRLARGLLPHRRAPDHQREPETPDQEGGAEIDEPVDDRVPDCVPVEHGRLRGRVARSDRREKGDGLHGGADPHDEAPVRGVAVQRPGPPGDRIESRGETGHVHQAVGPVLRIDADRRLRLTGRSEDVNGQESAVDRLAEPEKQILRSLRRYRRRTPDARVRCGRTPPKRTEHPESHGAGQRHEKAAARMVRCVASVAPLAPLRRFLVLASPIHPRGL